jgi:dTDP-4-amino-4,6-dideoxygalactose transaminase
MTRDEIILALRQRNVGAAIHYTPLHRMSFYATHARKDLPVSDQLARGLVTLPISASMDRSDARFVLEELSRVLDGGKRGG